MIKPLKIDYNIIPEDVIRQLQTSRPLVISARIFESVVAELLQSKIELTEEIDELNNKIASMPDQGELDDLQHDLDDLEKEKEDIDDEYTKFKTNLATFLSNNSDTVDINEMQSYFDSMKIDINEMIDEYSE